MEGAMSQLTHNERKELTEKLKKYAATVDIDLIGVADISELNEHAKIGRRPVDAVPTVRSIVVSGIGFLDPLTKCWANSQTDLTMPSSVAINLLFIRELQLKRFLRQQGYRSYRYFDSPGLFDVHIRQAEAFRLAGLGYVGKNNMAISKKYGPRMNLLTLLTEAPLVPDEPYTENHCGSCNLCQKFCTSGAIMDDGFYNARLCESVVNCWPSNAYFSLSSWFDCDICYRKCPQGEIKWTKEERRGDWWDIIRRNRESEISKHSIPLKDLNKNQ
jgi:epoxyqueuosine reductase QueG